MSVIVGSGDDAWLDVSMCRRTDAAWPPKAGQSRRALAIYFPKSAFSVRRGLTILMRIRQAPTPGGT